MIDMNLAILLYFNVYYIYIIICDSRPSYPKSKLSFFNILNSISMLGSLIVQLQIGTKTSVRESYSHILGLFY